MSDIVKYDDEASLWAFCQKVAQSTLLPEALKNKPADVFVTILAGRDFGLSAMQSFRGINVIKGKPCFSADLMVAQVLKSGLAEYFQLVSSDAKCAVYATKRKGGEKPTEMHFTMEQAITAGLPGRNPNYKIYPDAMLRARCASALARAVYPDVLFGVYEEDEANDIRASEREAQKSTAARVINPVPQSKALPAQTAQQANQQPEKAASQSPKADIKAIIAQIATATTIEQLKAARDAGAGLDPKQRDAIKPEFVRKWKAIEAAEKAEVMNREAIPSNSEPPIDDPAQYADPNVFPEPGYDG